MNMKLNSSFLIKNDMYISTIKSWGSSVITVSVYGRDNRAIRVRSLAEAKDLSSSLCVQTGSGAHSASYPMSTVVVSLEVKRS
jgi:hypothetical protein